MAALEASSLEVLAWLKTLPLAPEYHPTVEEFQDPIAYILKIEEEASRYGICKIVPPVPLPSKKAAVANFARSLAARGGGGAVGPRKQQPPPTFTTRQQQIGFCPRKARPVQKPVWQSGETYTLQQFEAKAKAFERAQLKKVGKKSLCPLEVETLFWKACADKPFSVEYANDMPGSAFAELSSGGSGGGGETLAETAWNMRGISRSKLSLLKFMKEEIPGVTSPMVYVAMMFSWFAWHVEDHDLHSLNYLHLGAGKTWYGVPRDAAVAFEEVVRVHGYGEEVNPLVTFAVLGEKTTVMSPEVLIAAGVPCCRLVQNAGEFVVTFPRAYHSGFSHGFNCGEASNIATPGWLRVAKEAAIRRACISYPPMLSHFQLLYNLALTLCSSVPKNFGSEPRSSRLKDKKRGEGEMVVKQLFVEDMIQNNELLHILRKRGSSCILLPQDSFELPLSSNSRLPLGYNIKVKSRLPLGSCSRQEPIGASNNFLCNDVMPERNPQHKSGFWSASGNSSLFLLEGKRVPAIKYSGSSSADLYTSPVDSKITVSGEGTTIHGDGLFDQGLLSCVTCGLLSFACVAVIQPTEAAAKHIMSSTCTVFNNDMAGSGIDYDQNPGSSGSEQIEEDRKDGLVDIVVQSGGYQLGVSSERAKLAYDMSNDKGSSALALLASAYGDSSDSEEELYEHKNSTVERDNGSALQSFTSNFTHLGSSTNEDTDLISHKSDRYDELSDLKIDNQKTARSIDPFNLDGAGRNFMAIPVEVSHPSEVLCRESLGRFNPYVETSGVIKCDSKMSTEVHPEDISKMCIMDTSIKNQLVPFCQTSDRDVSRMHIFCLEHAVEVERQLRQIGGVDMLLICHPDYVKVERRAKSVAKELAINYCWKDIQFREATAEDKEKIQTAIDDEEAIPGIGDWAVKLGVNLYYSSSLSKSPLYSKQMPYNEIIYKLFGQDSPRNSPVKLKVYSSKRSRKQKKLVVAGKWCGRVWMSNQVHPYLVHRDTEEHDPSKEPRCYNSDSADENREEAANSVTSETPPAEKRIRKRKNPFEIVATTKLKHQRLRDAISSEEDVPVKSSRGSKRILRSGLVKCATPVQIDRCKKTITSARKIDMKDETEDGPSSRLRKRPSKCKGGTKSKPPKVDKEVKKKKQKKLTTNSGNRLSSTLEKDEDAEYQCDMEGCTMGFSTKQDLILHKRNICLVKGCGKKFFSHKYLVQHRRVHLDERPLKCPWKGCKMTFKWAWARTEHIRVHTGERPYVCKEPGCGQTFRFVSDFSRHKRKTGHSLKKKGRG